MLLPERTVDVWACLAIEKLAPGTQFWAPTTNAQGLGEPDLYVEGLGKLMLFEHKGLHEGGGVVVGLKQFARLLWMQVCLRGHVFYGLPSGATFLQRKPAGTVQGQFGRHQMMFTPTDLLAEVLNQRVRAYPRKPNAKGPAYWRFKPSFFKNWGTTLDLLVRRARACQVGLRVESTQDLADVRSDVANAISSPIDIQDLGEWARSREVELPERLLSVVEEEAEAVARTRRRGPSTWRRPTAALVRV